MSGTSRILAMRSPFLTALAGLDVELVDDARDPRLDRDLRRGTTEPVATAFLTMSASFGDSVW